MKSQGPSVGAHIRILLRCQVLPDVWTHIPTTILSPPYSIVQSRRGVELRSPDPRPDIGSFLRHSRTFLPPTHLDNDKHSLGERVQDLDGRLALKKTGVVAGLEDIHDQSADAKQHQPTWESERQERRLINMRKDG